MFDLKTLKSNIDFSQKENCPGASGNKMWQVAQQLTRVLPPVFLDVLKPVFLDVLKPVFLYVLKPVFMNLSESKLLSTCVLGTTQNVNELLNGVVWSRCLKHKHHGPKAVRCAVATAVLQFHQGATSRERIMAKLLIPA